MTASKTPAVPPSPLKTFIDRLIVPLLVDRLVKQPSDRKAS